MENEARREKQAEPRLQKLRDLLTEGVDSGTQQVWQRETFLQKMKEKMKTSRD